DARGERHGLEPLVQHLRERPQLLVRYQVPLVYRHHDGLAPVERQVRQTQLVISQLERVHDEYADVRAPQRGFGADAHVVLKVVRVLASHAGRVYQHERAAGERERDVDGVTRGPRLFRDDHALVADQGVQETRLPDVGAADYRHPDGLLVRLLVLRR